MQGNQLESSFKEYIELSEVILQHYRKKPGGNFQAEFNRLETWLSTPVREGELNRPFVIESTQGAGRKTLLAHWHQYHKSRGREDIVILHFGSTKISYFQVIYKTLIRLRQFLNINQKVEIHGEKLRNYFPYWLDLCNRYINNQIINSCERIYSGIILVLQGIDEFVDAFNGDHPANVSLWLPQFFPPRIKVIVTGKRNSQAVEYFANYGCEVMPVEVQPSALFRIIDSKLARKTPVSAQTKTRVGGFLRKYVERTKFNLSTALVCNVLDMLVPEEGKGASPQLVKRLERVSIESFQECESLVDFIKNVIKELGKEESDFSEKFISILCAMVCAQKGLTLQQILLITKITKEDFADFQAVLSCLLIEHKGLWLATHEYLGQLIAQVVSPARIREVRVKIAEVLNKTPNSVRKLEEQTHQLCRSYKWFKLKEVVSEVQNLLLLFSPVNKFALCRYWEQLEKNNFDPVIEYNKAVEGFLMHYHPSSYDLFLIIVQVSRFMKEFSDFETYHTLFYRHPPVKGISRDLSEIRIFDELLAYRMCDEPDPRDQPDIKPVEQRVQALVRQIESGKMLPELSTSLALKREDHEKVRRKKPVRPQKISESNIEIKENRDKFRRYYEEQILELVQEEGRSGTRELCDIKDLQQLVNESKRLLQLQVSNYYYKRWIWMQFPWVCMSLRCNYSDKMKKCSTSPTQYMSVEQETTLTFQALSFALAAKLKKQQVLESKVMTIRELLGFVPRPPPSRPEFATVTRFTPDSRKHALYNPSDYLQLSRIFKEKKGYPADASKQKPSQENTYLSFYLTQVRKEKDNSMSSDKFVNTALPKLSSRPELSGLKKQAGEKASRMEKIEKSNESLKQTFNQLCAENKRLAQKLNKLKIMEYNELNERKLNKEIEEMRRRIKEGEQRKAGIIEDYAYSLVEQERLLTLIKVCNDNVNSNEESIKPLVIESNNFRAMIRVEKEEIKFLHGEIQRLGRTKRKVLENINLRRQAEMGCSSLLNQTLKGQSQFEHKVAALGNSVELAFEHERSRIRGLEEDSKAEPEQPKEQEGLKENKYPDSLQLKRSYRMLREKFGVFGEDNLESSPSFKKFVEQVDTNNQLNFNVLHLREKMEKLEAKISQLERELSTQPERSSLDEEFEAEYVRQTFLSPAEWEREVDNPTGLWDRRRNEMQAQIQKCMAKKLKWLGFLGVINLKLQRHRDREKQDQTLLANRKRNKR